MLVMLAPYEQKRINDVLDQDGHGPHTPVGDDPHLKNKKHSIGLDRWNDDFGGGTPPDGTSVGKPKVPDLTPHHGYNAKVPGDDDD